MPKGAFILGDVLLLGLGGFIVWQAARPLDPWHVLLLFLCVFTGAWLAVYPFLAEYKAAQRLSESSALDQAIAQMSGMEAVGKQIVALSSQWQAVQDHTNRTVQAVQEISDRMGSEAKAFSELSLKMNQQEKAHLRLEVEKLRRAEGEWVQVIMGYSDHIFAFFQAAVRSGEQRLIEQIGRMQAATQEIARRVGLVGVGAAPEEAFDAARHQLQSGETPPEGSKIGNMVAPGYMYQGQLVRRVLVTLDEEKPEPVKEEQVPQTQLPI